MPVASLREVANFTNNTNYVTPYTLGQVLKAFTTNEDVQSLIAAAQIDPSQVDLHEYAKKTDLPSKLSELTNDDNYVQTVSGLIPSNLLPSYVDDVLEYATLSSFPNPGESGKIYVALDTNLTYRWSGTAYVEISKSLALGITSTTAFRGDYGNTAYTHSQATGNPHGLALSDLGITVSASVINYLTGLSDTVVNELAKKLPLSGGILTGFLTLHADPTANNHAANKHYVDALINGLSVTITQNVTAIGDLDTALGGLSRTVGAQAETLTTVQGDISGLQSTTSDHTTAIGTLETGLSGVQSTVSKTSERVTTLESSVKLYNVELAKYAVIVQVDTTNKPKNTETNTTGFTSLFKGSAVTPSSVSISGSHAGLTCTYNNGAIDVSYNSTMAIPNQAVFSITFTYIDNTDVDNPVTYTDTKELIVTSVAQGVDGQAGQDAAIISPVEPSDTTKLWFNTTNNMFYIYDNNDWVIVNDMSNYLTNLQDGLQRIPTLVSNALDTFENDVIKESYYTKEEMGSVIEQSFNEFNIDFINRLETAENIAGSANAKITDMSGYIHTGTSEGRTYLELGNVSSDFKVKIENDRMAILYKGNEITKWEQNLFEVETVISKLLHLGKFAFIVNEPGTENESLSFRKLS